MKMKYFSIAIIGLVCCTGIAAAQQTPQPLPQPQAYTFTITVPPDTARAIFDALTQIPWGVINPTIQTMVGQMKAQQVQQSPPTPPSSSPPPSPSPPG